MMLSLIVFYKEFSSYIQGWLLQYVSAIWYGELNIVGELAVLKEFGMFKGREIVSSETWFWKSLNFPQTLDSSKIVT